MCLNQISDALLKLNVAAAGAVPDIGKFPLSTKVSLYHGSDICLAPILRSDVPKPRIVAPISTILYVPKARANSTSFPESIPSESNIPKDKHWTECSAPGSVVLIQQPQGQICALIGDIIATRLKLRGVLGVVAVGRTRDVAACAALCKDGDFQMWSQGFSAAAPSLETKPWMMDIPLQLGELCVKPGDIICVDEGEMALVVIPRGHLERVFDLLPVLKEASDAVLLEVENGTPLMEATKRHPDFYSNHK